jgi:3-oxoacyl-(acyl-carrier-protein) synthase
MFVLENLERAEARGARIYLELTVMPPNAILSGQYGSGLRSSMELALANAAAKRAKSITYPPTDRRSDIRRS